MQALNGFSLRRCGRAFCVLQGGWVVTLRGTLAGYVAFSLASPFTLRKKLSAAITAPMAIP